MEQDLINGIMNNEIVISIPISLFTQPDGKPALQMRKTTNDLELLQAILYCASKGKTIVCKPVFKDELRALSSMKEKGLIKKEDNGELRFNFF